MWSKALVRRSTRLAVASTPLAVAVAAAAAPSSASSRGQQQVRFHHPDPFNPKMTKGWKAALKVRTSRRFDVAPYFFGINTSNTVICRWSGSFYYLLFFFIYHPSFIIYY
jgi:hypothetical protein